jgi:hypothetical protein
MSVKNIKRENNSNRAKKKIFTTAKSQFGQVLLVIITQIRLIRIVTIMGYNFGCSTRVISPFARSLLSE